MKLRFCTLIASTLLAGCVLTDESNQTGGDFLSSHGATVLPSAARSFAVPVLSVESVPMEGVPGSHGTDNLVLGSLGKDSIRLILGFNLADSTLRDTLFKLQKDSLTRIRLMAYDFGASLKVRARFLLLDSNQQFLPGLLAGVEPTEMSLVTLADTVVYLPAPLSDSSVILEIPASVNQLLGQKRRQAELDTTSSWMVVLLDKMTDADANRRFLGKVTMIGPDSSLPGVPKYSGSVALGTYDALKAFHSVGFRSATGPVVGWWPAGGSRLRVRLNAAKLRADLGASYGIAPDQTGGFDNTFNVIQARISAPFSNVLSDASAAFPITISSTVLIDSAARPSSPASVDFGAAGFTLKMPVEIPLSAEELRSCGLTVNPILTFKQLPGVYQMELNTENQPRELPTRRSLAQGSYTSALLFKSTFRVGEDVEFSIAQQHIRVRVSSDKNKVTVKFQLLERDPVSDGQYKADSLRTEAQLRTGSTKLTQEIRTPLTQVLNRWRPVEIELTPSALANISSRLIAPPTDPSRVFDSIKVVVRPLIGRNN